MFYDRYVQLCQQAGVKPSAVGVQAGVPKSAVSNWKKKWEEGLEVLPSAETLSKLSDYFGVTTDYLLGKTGPDVAAAPADGDVTLDDFTYAFLHESRQLTAHDKEVLLNMARFMRLKLHLEQELQKVQEREQKQEREPDR